MSKVGKIFKDIFEYVDLKQFQDTKDILLNRKAKAEEDAVALNNEIKKVDATIANIIKANAEEKKANLEKQKIDAVTKKQEELKNRQKKATDNQGVGTVVKTEE